MTNRHRLLGLEDRTAALVAADAARIADVEGEVAWLGKPSIVAIWREFSEHLARRRWLHDHPEDDPREWGRFPLDERRHLAHADGPPPGIGTVGLHPAIRAWLEEPDRLGWPALRFPACDYAAFVARLADHRRMLDGRRGADDEVGARYRERHPSWCPGLTPDQHDRLDWGLLIEAAKPA